MAEVLSSKRQRYESEIDSDSDVEESKRHKSISNNHILSILEEEELDESIQDLSSLISTLQQEPIASSSSATTAGTIASSSAVEEDEEVIIRHLLEASDDELGIPNTNRSSSDVEVEEYEYEYQDGGGDGFKIDGCDGLSVCDGLWEFEDANANYYTLLHSQLFM